MNDETLSSFWRRRRSQDRSISLRDLQNELSYLARLILKDERVQVAWHQNLIQESSGNDKILILDSTPVDDIPEGQAVPDDRVDTLVGDTLFRAHLEALERDAVFGAVSRVLASSTDPDIERKTRVLAAVKHLKAYFVGLDANPAAREYVNSSREWKKDHIAELAESLSMACSVDDIAFEDVLDLWAMFLVYGSDIGNNVKLEVFDAIQQASRATYQVMRDDKLTYRTLSNRLDTIAQSFTGFKNRKDIVPPAPTPGEGEAGDEGGDQDSDDGSGQSSPDGTDKENEGEEPEGGPDDEAELHGDQDAESEADTDRPTDDTSVDKESSDDDQASNSDSSSQSDDSDGDEDSDEEDSDDEDQGSGGGSSSLPDDDEDFEDDEEEDGEPESSDDGDNDDGDQDSEQSSAPGQAAAVAPLDRVREQAESGPMIDALDQINTISDEESEAIREAVEFAREDISAEVESYDNGDYPIIWEKAPYDAALEAKLRTEAYQTATGITEILHRFKRLRSRIEHGTLDGYKLDNLRLGRLAYGNQHVFKRRSVINKLDMCLVLLLDSSSSIDDTQWETIIKVAASFVQAVANRDDVELIVESYTETGTSYRNLLTGARVGGSANSMLRIYDKRMGRMQAVRKYKHGTPSAMALASIRDSIFKRLKIRQRDKVVIHLTDGYPTDGAEEVQKQVRLNKEAGIETYCILVQDIGIYNQYAGYYRSQGLSDDSFKECYGNNFQKLESYSKLLKCLTDLFGKITEAR